MLYVGIAALAVASMDGFSSQYNSMAVTKSYGGLGVSAFGGMISPSRKVRQFNDAQTHRGSSRNTRLFF